jgi:hypothetical protein
MASGEPPGFLGANGSSGLRFSGRLRSATRKSKRTRHSANLTNFHLARSGRECAMGDLTP